MFHLEPLLEKYQSVATISGYKRNNTLQKLAELGGKRERGIIGRCYLRITFASRESPPFAKKSRIYKDSENLYKILTEINSAISPIVEEDFSSQIEAGKVATVQPTTSNPQQVASFR